MAGRCSEPEPRSGKSCAAPLQAPSSSHAQAPSVPPSQVPGIPPSQALGVSQPALTTPQLTTPTEVDVEIQHRAAVVVPTQSVTASDMPHGRSWVKVCVDGGWDMDWMSISWCALGRRWSEDG